VKVVEKIQAKVVPSTIQLAYLGIQTVDLDFDVMTFKDGSVFVKLKNPEAVTKGSSVYIEAYLENMNDLMQVAQMKDIVCRLAGNNAITTVLTITSPMYSRYDRVMLDDQSDSFGAKVFGDFVRAMKFSIIRYVDCHSRVLVDYSHPAHTVTQYDLFQHMKNTYPELDDMLQIVPDKGACVKNQRGAIVMNKTRDVTNGKITGQYVEKAYTIDPDKRYIVVDDLCEGGGTFLGLASVLQESYPQLSRPNLYVSHGLFTNDAIPKLLKAYTNIYVYIMKRSVHEQLTGEEQQRVKVLYLVNA